MGSVSHKLLHASPIPVLIANNLSERETAPGNEAVSIRQKGRAIVSFA